MSTWRIKRILVMVIVWVTKVSPSYDKEKFEKEEKLLFQASRGVSPNFPQYSAFNNHEVHQDLPVAQPLNYRLPSIPQPPPSMRGPEMLEMRAAEGQTVVLPCRVVNLGQYSVSWLRGLDDALTVLSHAAFLFSSSPRHKILHSQGSPDWTLQIGPVVLGDSGVYECQVNTEDKMWRKVKLRILSEERRYVNKFYPGPAMALLGGQDLTRERAEEGKTQILAPDVMEVKEGDTVTLECVTMADRPPKKFSWSINRQPLDLMKHRGGILLQSQVRHQSSVSRITITRLKVSDSGVYTCIPEGAHTASVSLIVGPENLRLLSCGNLNRKIYAVMLLFSILIL